MRINVFSFIPLLLINLIFGQTNPPMSVEIDPDIQYQTIHNFGASDAWSAQFVGNWPMIIKNQIADLLFSTDLDDKGSPIGIGLSAWRFNIGAGSSKQGAESDIKDEWRRAEGFLNNDGSYNWNRQAGQQWFLQAAKKRGVSCFIGFVNSPPVQFTKNHKGYSTDGISANIALGLYDDYAIFLKNAIEYFKDSLQIDFTYISPFNEPQWEWKDAGQEGTPWNNSELARASQIIDSVFVKYNVSPKIEITEAGAIDYLTSKKNKFNDRSDQVESFFNPESKCYIGNLKYIAKKFSGHSYFTTWPIETLKKERIRIAETLKKYPDLEYWMTEYCVLENNEDIKGIGKDVSMKTALYVARIIHSDLTIAQASAWHWWLAMTPYNYKDGLIYLSKTKTNGTFETSKLLWGLGNFSRFIRPGAKRIHVAYDGFNTIENLKEGVLVSAFKNLDGSIIVVIVNQKKEGVNIDLKHKIKGMFTTNKNLDLKQVMPELKNNQLRISGNSINTIVF